MIVTKWADSDHQNFLSLHLQSLAVESTTIHICNADAHKLLRPPMAGCHNKAASTVFARSEAAATINFTARFCVATIREQHLIK